MTLTVLASSVEYNNTHSLLFKGAVYQNYLTVVSSTSINQGSSDVWSLSFWIRMNTVQESIFWSQGISSNYRFVGCDDNGALVLSFGKSGKFKIYVSQEVLPANVWVHVVVTNTPCTMWINGVDATATLQVNTLTSATNNTQNMWICRGPGASTEGFFPEVNLDELAYWDISLSSGQVTTLYNAGVPFDLSTVGFASHLKQWLLMGDGDAFPLISDNAVGGTHDATMINMTAWNIVNDTP